jgi:hypothetical protein
MHISGYSKAKEQHNYAQVRTPIHVTSDTETCYIMFREALEKTITSIVE